MCSNISENMDIILTFIQFQGEEYVPDVPLDMPVDSAETPVESPSDTPLGTPNHKQQVKVLFYNVFFLYSIIIIAYFQWRIHKLLGRGMKN